MNFINKLVKLLDDKSIEQARKDVAKAFKGYEKSLKESDILNLDFKKFEEEFDKISTQIKDEVKTVYENAKAKFAIEPNQFETIVVSYDRDTDILHYALDGNTLTIEVKDDTTEDNQHYESIQRTFPYCVDHVEQSYNREEKTMTFKVVTCSTVTDEEEDNEDPIFVEEGDDAMPSDELLPGVPDDLNVEVPQEAEDDCLSALERENQRILELFNEGKSYRAISREVGVSDKTVARRIKKMLDDF